MPALFPVTDRRTFQTSPVCSIAPHFSQRPRSAPWWPRSMRSRGTRPGIDAGNPMARAWDVRQRVAADSDPGESSAGTPEARGHRPARSDARERVSPRAGHCATSGLRAVRLHGRFGEPLFDCVMDFRRVADQKKVSMLLERRSLLVLSDVARYDWELEIARRKTDRWNGLLIPRHWRLSVTFRRLKPGRRSA